MRLRPVRVERLTRGGSNSVIQGIRGFLGHFLDGSREAMGTKGSWCDGQAAAMSSTRSLILRVAKRRRKGRQTCVHESVCGMQEHDAAFRIILNHQ
jgi:hypothetical protein